MHSSNAGPPKKEYNAALQGLFIDIKGACDSDNGEVLRSVLSLVCSWN